jgi:sugar lactone lactonase YvrE
MTITMRRGLVSLLLALSATACLGCKPEVLVEGARLHSANGMAFDAAGQLHVASILASEIVQLNPQNGQVLGRVGRAEGVDGPDDITFGPDGSLYWTALAAGEVGRRTPTGVTTRQRVAPGVTTTQKVAPGVNPIAFSADGRLFVALAFLGDALYELDPALVAPPRLIAQNFGFLNGMSFGPDGRLYAPVFTQGRVVSIDVDSCAGAIDPDAECDVRTVASGFFLPAAVKFDAAGRLHVVDQSGEVFRVNLATGQKKVVVTLAPGLDNLAFDSRFGRLFVSSANDGFVVRVPAEGSVKTLSPGGMVAPGGLALLGPADAEALYVADVFTMRVFDPQRGEQIDQIIPFAGQTPQTTPTNVAADGANLIVSSWFGNAVQVWGPSGQVLESYGDFAIPNAALRFEGDLVVAEVGFGPGAARVVRQTAAGLVALAEGIGLPAGLAASGGDLWFSDWSAGAIYQLVDDGAVLSSPSLVAAGLDRPEGLAVAHDGTLLVVESGAGRLSRVDPATGTVTTLAEGLATGLPAITGLPASYILSGVVQDAVGDIYVSGDLDNVIYRL